MANIFKNLLDSLKLTDDDELDDFDNEVEEKEVRVVERRERKPARKTASMDLSEKEPIMNQIPIRNNYEVNTTKKEKDRTERANLTKVVPIRTVAKGLEVSIMKPTSFEDSQEICDVLLSGRAVVINLEGFDENLAQRIMDFISGAVYALNGKLHQISNYIFIISPDAVDISGDYLDFIKNDGFEVPTFNKDF